MFPDSTTAIFPNSTTTIFSISTTAIFSISTTTMFLNSTTAMFPNSTMAIATPTGTAADIAGIYWSDHPSWNQNQTSQASHLDPLEIFLPVFYVAGIGMAHALTMCIAVFLVYSITGLGGWILGHRTCGTGRHALSVVLVAILGLFSVLEGVIFSSGDPSTEAWDVLARGCGLFYSFVLASSPVLGCLGVGQAIRSALRNDGAPQHRSGCGKSESRLTGTIALVLMAPALAHTFGFDWTAETVQTVQQIWAFLPQVAYFVGKVLLFICSLMWSPTGLLLALCLCFTMCGTYSRQDLLAAASTRIDPRSNARPILGVCGLWALCLHVCLISLVSARDEEKREQGEPSLDFSRRTIQFILGWTLVDIAIVTLTGFGKLAYMAYRACMPRWEEQQDAVVLVEKGMKTIIA